MIEIFQLTWAILVLSIPAYSGWVHYSKISPEIPWGLWFPAKSKLQEKQLEAQFNSQDILVNMADFKGVFVPSVKKGIQQMCRSLEYNLRPVQQWQETKKLLQSARNLQYKIQIQTAEQLCVKAWTYADAFQSWISRSTAEMNPSTMQVPCV